MDYSALLARLTREFPAESFLIVRYGDHQPQFGPRIIDPLLGKAAACAPPDGIGSALSHYFPENTQTRASAYATRFFARGKGDNLTAEDLAYWVVDPQVKRRYIEAFVKSSILSMMSYYKANYSFSQLALNLFDPTMKKLYGAVIKCPVLHVHGIEESHALLSTLDLEKSWIENPDNLTVKIVPGVGHFIQHEVPDYLNQTIASWLKDSGN